MYQLTEIQLRLLLQLLVQQIKLKIASPEYPYGYPNERGVGDKIASGQLYDSIDYDVEYATDGTPMGILYYADYFKYVNRGTKPNEKYAKGRGNGGTSPFIQSLLKWISIRGINATNENGIAIPPLSLAFAIRQNIFRYGIRETNIYNKALDDFENIFDDFPNNLPEDLRMQAEQLFEEVAEDINIFYQQKLKIELPTD
jgi:hypothetical protein